MEQFILIDLDTQIKEFSNRVEGFTEAEIISWLGQYGEVHTSHDKRLQGHYRFTSKAGIVTLFRITDTGEMYVIRDHTLVKVR
jgi:hypothetical protein